MIGKLTGTLDNINGSTALIDVHGVGYVVQCSGRTLQKINGAGAGVSLLIETQVREDAITLIGFADAAEQAAFRMLTTVQGVGAKVALSILSTLAPEQLSQAVRAGDKALLSSADGVGPKLAARLLTELKDKIGQLGYSAIAGTKKIQGTVLTAPSGGGVAGDVVSSLVNLGFRREEAFSAVMAILSQDDTIGFDDLLRRALKDCAPRSRGAA